MTSIENTNPFARTRMAVDDMFKGAYQELFGIYLPPCTADRKTLSKVLARLGYRHASKAVTCYNGRPLSYRAREELRKAATSGVFRGTPYRNLIGELLK